jgi:23S rRNA (pseudouridine1915-N3)-methyltransferase
MPQKIRLISVGKIKDRCISSSISEYEKRIAPYARLETTIISDDGIKVESDRIIEHISKSPENTFILDAKGKELSSEEFAGLLKHHAETSIVFIVGGPDGISEKAKKSAKLISLSKMTFTHEMARLFLTEQIYRACMINNNRKYHK